MPCTSLFGFLHDRRCPAWTYAENGRRSRPMKELKGDYKGFQYDISFVGNAEQTVCVFAIDRKSVV